MPYRWTFLASPRYFARWPPCGVPTRERFSTTWEAVRRLPGLGITMCPRCSAFRKHRNPALPLCLSIYLPLSVCLSPYVCLSLSRASWMCVSSALSGHAVFGSCSAIFDVFLPPLFFYICCSRLDSQSVRPNTHTQAFSPTVSPWPDPLSTSLPSLLSA